MSDEKSGIASALDDVEIGEPPGESVEQLPLIPASEVAASIGEAIAASTPRGPGRPPGSPNKRTKAWTDYILSRYQSPLVVLAETYSRKIGDLVTELDCDPLEAFKLQLDAARALAPYVHQKQPIAVDTSNIGAIPLVIQLGGGEPVAPDGSNAIVIDGEVIDVEEAKKQALTTPDQGDLDNPELDKDA